MCLELNNVTIIQGDQYLLAPVNLSVEKGCIYTLMGPSGCGKSTLLSFIAGTNIAGTRNDPFTYLGDIQLGQRSLSNVPVEKRQVGILFQDPLLFPHMTVLQNLMFASSSGNAEEKRHKAFITLQTIGLEACADYFPKQLSGGQAARVSLMRTLAAEPEALLLDEPFSKLDQDTRGQFREQVYNTIIECDIPAILVTHDEADIADTRRVLRLNPEFKMKS